MKSNLFAIDPERLDEEWVKFANEYYNRACQLADARMDYEILKSKRDLIVAELDRDIRTNPDSFGINKVTETVIENTILLQEKYKKVNEEVIKTKHDVDNLDAAIEAMNCKKSGLENMVKLRLANYYSDPIVKNEKVSEEKIKEIRKQGQIKRD